LKSEHNGTMKFYLCLRRSLCGGSRPRLSIRAQLDASDPRNL